MKPESGAPSGLEEPESGGGGLPVDPRALVLSFLQLRWWLGGAIALSMVIGVVAAKLLAERTYTAETLMLYQAPPIDTPEGSATPSLLTLLNMVKLPSNLESVIEQLDLGVDTRTLGGATNVDLQAKTTLVVIKARWGNARVAADIANTLRETFLREQGRLRREDAESRARDVEARIASVNEQMAVAEESLRAFTRENRVVHLSEEARALLVELGTVNLLYEQARLDKRAIDIQAENADRIIKELQAEMAKEQEVQAALSDAMSETNIRIQRLRESIMDDREERYNEALLEEARLNLERAQKGFAEGVVAKEVLDEATAKYRALEARAVDTPQIEAWRQEMEELDQKVIPSGGSAGGLTGNLLKDVMFRSFEIKLQQTTAEERVESMRQAKERVEARLERLPDLQRTFAQLTRDVTALETEKSLLEQRLGEAKRLVQASALPFTLVSEASPPPRSSSSNTRKIAILVTGLLGGLSFFSCALFVVLDPRIRTKRELELALGGDLLVAELPEVEQAEGDDLENLRPIARRLRTAFPQKGVKLLLTSAGHEEGSRSVVRDLARLFARWGESVLVVDVHMRTVESVAPEPAGRWQEIVQNLKDQGLRRAPLPSQSSVEDLLEATPKGGLSDLITDRGVGVEELICATAEDGLAILPRSRGSESPDLLAQPRFQEVIQAAADKHTIILIDAPPVLMAAETENAALVADSIVLVARAMGPHRGAIRSAGEKFNAVGKSVGAAILNGTRPPYAEGSSPLAVP